MKIVPASLRQNLKDIDQDIKSVSGVCDIFSIDICDGIFVDSKTWLPTEEDLIIAKNIFSKYNFDLEFDLMAEDPVYYIQKAKDLSIKKVVIHGESKEILERSISLCKTYNIKAGLCSSNMSLLKEFAKEADYIQIMGIEKVGYQHQPFSEKTIALIAEVRKFYTGPIQIDGGLDLENIKKCILAGADDFVLGSKIFGEGDHTQNYLNILKGLEA